MTLDKMDRKESRTHKQEDKHMDRYTGRESRHYPIRLLKAIQARKQSKEEKNVKREKTETESATDKRDREKHQSTAGGEKKSERQKAVQRKIHCG